jgi:flagellar basal body P-ring formation protein FlgA
MIRTTIAALVALAVFGVSANAQVTSKSSPARPALKPEAIVTGDIVRIGDLIENAGIVSSVAIFRAPDLGFTGTISADAVLEAVRSHALIGLDTAGIREVVVRRASRTIQVADVEDVVAQALSTRFELGPSKDIVVNFSRELRAVYVEPSAQGSPRIAHIDFDARSGRFDATLEIPATGGKSNLVRLAGRAVPTAEVPTVTRPLDRGVVLRESDIQMERRPRTEITRDVVTSRSQVIGFAARTNLQPGRPLRTGELMKPDLVQRSEAVTLVYEAPGIVLTLRGKAIDGGAEGDAISVMNEQSKRIVQGTIVGPGRVAIRNSLPRFAATSATRSEANTDAR